MTVLSDGTKVILIDPRSQYVLAFSQVLSLAEVARIEQQWGELIAGRRAVMVLPGAGDVRIEPIVTVNFDSTPLVNEISEQGGGSKSLDESL